MAGDEKRPVRRARARLRQMKVAAIGLVDRPANEREFLVVKSDQAAKALASLGIPATAARSELDDLRADAKRLEAQLAKLEHQGAARAVGATKSMNAPAQRTTWPADLAADLSPQPEHDQVTKSFSGWPTDLGASAVATKKALSKAINAADEARAEEDAARACDVAWNSGGDLAAAAVAMGARDDVPTSDLAAHVALEKKLQAKVAYARESIEFIRKHQPPGANELIASLERYQKRATGKLNTLHKVAKRGW